MRTNRKIAITVAALVLIALHWRIPTLAFDASTWALIGVALLPWLSNVLDTVEFAGWKFKLRELQQLMREQETKIDDQQEIIKRLVIFSMSHEIFEHLWHIYDGEVARRQGKSYDYNYQDNFPFRREMYYLRDNGFIQPKLGGPLDRLDFDERINGRNLVDIAVPTPIGGFYVEIRRKYENAQEV